MNFVQLMPVASKSKVYVKRALSNYMRREVSHTYPRHAGTTG